MASAKKKTADLRRENADLKDEKSKLKKEVADLKKGFEGSKKDNYTQSEEIAKLQSFLAEEKKKSASLQEDVEKARRETAAIQKEFDGSDAGMMKRLKDENCRMKHKEDWQERYDDFQRLGQELPYGSYGSRYDDDNFIGINCYACKNGGYCCCKHSKVRIFTVAEEEVYRILCEDCFEGNYPYWKYNKSNNHNDSDQDDNSDQDGNDSE